MYKNENSVLDMRFLPMLIGVYCLFFFGFSTMITPAPIGVAKTPFLKHMLQQEPSESQNISKENTSLHQKAKKKQGVKTKIPNFIYVLIETISGSPFTQSLRRLPQAHSGVTP